jgi:hypothetical protein
MALLPLEFKYGLPCRKPETILYALETGMDLRILSLATIEIWNHIDVIKQYVAAGGVINLAFLSFAVRNSKCNLIEVLALFDTNMFAPTKNISGDDFYDSDEEVDKKDSQDESFLMKNLCKEQYVDFIGSPQKLLYAVLESKRSGADKLSCMNLIFDMFDVEYNSQYRFDLNVFVGEKDDIIYNLLEKLLNKKLLSIGSTLYRIFSSDYDDDFIIKITNYLYTIDPDSFDDRAIKKCVMTGSAKIIKHFHDLGFDIFSDPYLLSAINTDDLFRKSNIQFWNQMLEYGADLKNYFPKIRYGFNTENQTEKIIWFLDNCNGLEETIKSNINAWKNISPELKQRLGLEIQN